MIGVYAITHCPTGRTYIGASGTVVARWSRHCSALTFLYHANTALQDDWKRDGPTAFSFAVLEVVRDKAALAERELAWKERYRAEGIALYQGVRDNAYVSRPPKPKRRETRVQQTRMYGIDPAELCYREMYWRGKTAAQIGKRYGVSESTVLRWVRDWIKKHPCEGVTPDQMPRAAEPAELAS